MVAPGLDLSKTWGNQNIGGGVKKVVITDKIICISQLLSCLQSLCLWWHNL